MAREFAVLRRGDAWWCALAVAAGIALYAWRVPLVFAAESSSIDATEALAGSGALGAVAWACGAIGFAGFAVLSLVLALIDTRTLRLPNRVLLLSAAWLLVWLLPAAADDAGRIGRAAITSALLAMIFLALWLRWRHLFGGGDVKLAPLCGFAAAWIDPGALIAFFIALFATTVPVFVIALRSPAARLPFGPSILVATWLVIAVPTDRVLG